MHNKKYPIRIKKRFVTLIEMMIVMFLIALITGVVAYNYRGTLEKGKAFQTQAGIQRLQNILSLSLAEDPSLDLSAWQEIVKRSPLVQDPNALIKDGWGFTYQVGMSTETNEIVVWSEKFNQYSLKK